MTLNIICENVWFRLQGSVFFSIRRASVTLSWFKTVWNESTEGICK